MITIIDYGLGNIRAFTNVYERLNIEVRIAQKANDLRNATKVILPGVGAFDHAMMQLNSSGMREELERQVMINQVPVLGICVGMQILARSSDEGLLPGLGWIDGTVKLFDTSKINGKPKLPHMGWNTVRPLKENTLMTGLNDGSRFYFLHSYYFACNDSANVISTTEYGITFASAVNHNNVFGIQFHPEKSHSNGIRVLQNFASL
jgi:glutamine amidotransferase